MCLRNVRLILQRLPDARGSLPIELYDQVDLDLYRLRQTFDGDIELARGEGDLPPVGPGPEGKRTEERDPLSVIIEELNGIYSIATNGDAEAAIEHLQRKLGEDLTLEKGAQANPPDTFRLLFDQVADEQFGDMIDAFFKFYKQVTDHPQAKERLFDWLFEQYRKGQE